MDEVNKIWTPKKKDQSADTNTPPEIKKFLPYPSEKTQRSKDADAHNPSEMAFSNPLRSSRPLVYINGPYISLIWTPLNYGLFYAKFAWGKCSYVR